MSDELQTEAAVIVLDSMIDALTDRHRWECDEPVETHVQAVTRIRAEEAMIDAVIAEFARAAPGYSMAGPLGRRLLRRMIHHYGVTSLIATISHHFAAVRELDSDGRLTEAAYRRGIEAVSRALPIPTIGS